VTSKNGLFLEMPQKKGCGKTAHFFLPFFFATAFFFFAAILSPS
jgi:hypothetical protein